MTTRLGRGRPSSPGGRIIDTAGDGILAEFPSVIAATECAVQIQTVMAERNDGVSEHRRMRFRIGLNLRDVIHDDARIYGDGINIAARLSCRSPASSNSPCGRIGS
jgi:adenylate cyclase